jgi:hypothetical protein
MLLDIAATPSATDETQVLSVPIELRRSGRERICDQSHPPPRSGKLSGLRAFTEFYGA